MFPRVTWKLKTIRKPFIVTANCLLSNNLFEKFTITEKDNTFWLNYKTEHTSWTEELINLSNDKLVVKNSNDLMYFYTKRTDLNKE